MVGGLTDRSLLSIEVDEGFMHLDRQSCIAAGQAGHAAYVEASPFPHAIFNDFLPLDMLQRVVREFPRPESGRFDNAQSRLKTGYQLDKIASPCINGLINALNAAHFLSFLQELTGIAGLIPDPWQVGGGLHETRRGGHLSIHADFNKHPQMNLRRRLNLIMFLNEDWDESYGGHLELWAKDMAHCESRVLPTIGTAVIFNTDADSFHGHPDPLTCPEDRTRRSLALYYYTADLAAKEASRTTDFQVRPASSDARDYSTRSRELLRDLCPPVVYRMLH